MKQYFFVFSLIFFLISSPSWSQENTGREISCQGCQPHESRQDLEVQAISQLLHIFHYAMEGEYKKSFSIKETFQSLKSKEKWIQLFNFSDVIRRAVRAFNIQPDKNLIKNHAKNLALLFPFSHFVEVMASPVFVAVGTANEFSNVTLGIGASMLSIMSIPGLDPLCILLFAAYPLKPVHKSIDSVRSMAERSIRAVITVMNLDTLFSKFYTHEDRFQFIRQQVEEKYKNGSVMDIEIIPIEKGHRLSLSDKLSGEKILSLTRMWQEEEKRFYIHSVYVSQSAVHPILKKNFLKWLSWNARSAVREILKLRDHSQKISAYKREFFVDEVIVNDKGIEVFYKNKAIYLDSKIRRQTIKNNPCKNSFI